MLGAIRAHGAGHERSLARDPREAARAVARAVNAGGTVLARDTARETRLGARGNPIGHCAVLRVRACGVA